MAKQVEHEDRMKAKGYTMSETNWQQYWNAVILVDVGDFKSYAMRKLDLKFRTQHACACPAIVLW